MAKVPETLARKEHVELTGPNVEEWARRIGLLLLAATLALGLANFFGQATGETAVENDAARLTLRAPADVRAGLFYQVMLRIDAREGLTEPTLVLDPGW